MKRVSSKSPAAALRPWRVSIIRHRMEILGRVAATDAEAAEAAAVQGSNLNDEQRKRLVLQELP